MTRRRTFLAWGASLAIAASGVLAPAAWLGLIAVAAALLFGATAGWQRTLRDARPLLWHAPALLLAMWLVQGAIDLWQIAVISTRLMLTALPLFWLHRMVSPTELLRLFDRTLPLRLRLLLIFGLRLWPLLLGNLGDLVLLAKLDETLPSRWHRLRPRHLRRTFARVVIPAALQAIRLSDDLALNLEARGLDELLK